MAALVRLARNLGKHVFLPQNSRSTGTWPPQHQVKIVEKQEGNNLIIEGIWQDPAKDPLIIKNETKACPLCALGVDVKHTDVLILKQFVRPDGCMLPRRITGLCLTQQRRVGMMVAMAQKAGLMSNLTPDNSAKDPSKRRKWKKFNQYYDESTIPFYLYYKKY